MSYKVPGLSLRDGLRELKDGKQVMEMIEFGMVDVYLEADLNTKYVIDKIRKETEVKVIDITDWLEEMLDGDYVNVDTNMVDEKVQNLNVVCEEETTETSEDLNYNLVEESEMEDELEDN